MPHVFLKDAIRQERTHQSEVNNLKSKFSQEDKVIGQLLNGHIACKKTEGDKLKAKRVSASVLDQIVDFISYWIQPRGLPDNWFCQALRLKQ